MNIREEAIELMHSELSNFSFSQERKEKMENKRKEFKEYFNEDKLKKLQKEDYFAGLGKKKGCLAYELEWGTKELGSIKGGSKYKYGYEADFDKIKTLLNELISFQNKYEDFYSEDGQLSEKLQNICKQAKKINGFKTGRTVLPKLLSIYYPNVFLPVFNDADYFLSEILDNYVPDKTGLELYLENNCWLLKAKNELDKISEEEINTFSGYKYMVFLYHCFPKEKRETNISSKKRLDDVFEEQEFEALEVQHYQTLIHRNFTKLFPNLEYFEEEIQKPKSGQYDTQTIGIMDFLTIEKETKDFVVIELKRKASDKTVGQLARYMGWVKDELCTNEQNVKGIIIAEKGDNYLDFALKVFSNVQFKKLELNLKIID